MGGGPHVSCTFPRQIDGEWGKAQIDAGWERAVDLLLTFVIMDWRDGNLSTALLRTALSARRFRPKWSGPGELT